MQSEKAISCYAFDSKSAGLRNERLVLSLLRRYGHLSQSELRRLAGIRSSTVSYIVGRLREKDLILEEPGESNKRGAKPIIVRINPQGRYVVGVEVNPSYLLLGLFDFDCNLVERVKVAMGTDHSPGHVMGLIEINLRGLLGKHGVDEEKLLGVGLTLSGTIGRGGTVELSSPLNWKDVPLREMVQNCFKVPVSVHTTRVRLLAEEGSTALVDQDLETKSKDAMLLAEGRANGRVPNDEQFRNVLYLHVGNGVGSHMTIDGHLVHGASGRSGEMGHMVVEAGGPLCGCGMRGCLEVFISGPALAKKIRGDIEAGRATVLAERVEKNDIPEEVVCKWGAGIVVGDAYCLELREFVGDYLSRAATLAVNFYDPNVVMLAGYVVDQCRDYLVERIEQRMAGELYDMSARQITIIPALAGDMALIRGVAKAILTTIEEIS